MADAATLVGIRSLRKEIHGGQAIGARRGPGRDGDRATLDSSCGVFDLAGSVGIAVVEKREEAARGVMLELRI